jgi:chorismate-pyruvate lyase
MGQLDGRVATPSPAAAPGLGRVEQLVLRGDGLTTTSLEILTGRDITVRVRRHWRMTLPASPVADSYTGTNVAAPAACSTVGYQDLGGLPGDDLLIREVLLCDSDGVIYATASLFAVLDRLPPDVARRLATTGAPIGKLLVRAGIQSTREIRRWGLLPAGDFAAHLGPAVRAETRVPARTYLMRSMETGMPLTLITEWFAPRLFDRSGAGHRR